MSNQAFRMRLEAITAADRAVSEFGAADIQRAFTTVCPWFSSRNLGSHAA